MTDVAVDASDLAVVERHELHRARLQPGDDLCRVPVRREDRIEDLRDRARLDDERDPLVERHALDVERRQAAAPRRAAAPGSAITGIRDVVPLRELDLVVERLRREPRDARAELRQLRRVVAERARLRRAAARAGDRRPSPAATGTPGRPARG